MSLDFHSSTQLNHSIVSPKTTSLNFPCANTTKSASSLNHFIVCHKNPIFSHAFLQKKCDYSNHAFVSVGPEVCPFDPPPVRGERALRLGRAHLYKHICQWNHMSTIAQKKVVRSKVASILVHSSHFLSTFWALAKIVFSAPILFASYSRGPTEHFLSLGQTSTTKSLTTRGPRRYNGKKFQTSRKWCCDTWMRSHELQEQLSNGDQRCPTHTKAAILKKPSISRAVIMGKNFK